MVRSLGVGKRKKQKNASGGKVSHLESGLRMLLALRTSGHVTFASGYAR